MNAIFTQQIQVKIRAAPGIRPGKRSKIAKIQAIIQAVPEVLPVLLSNDNKSGKSSSGARLLLDYSTKIKGMSCICSSSARLLLEHRPANLCPAFSPAIAWHFTRNSSAHLQIPKIKKEVARKGNLYNNQGYLNTITSSVCQR